jgi:hypothetical protein
MRTCKGVVWQWETESINLPAAAVNSVTPLASAWKVYGIPRSIFREWVGREKSSLENHGRNSVFPVDAKKQLRSKSKSNLYYERHSVGQSVLVPGTHLGPANNFSFSLKVSLDSCGFVILERSPWREDGSVISCCCWSSPAQSHGTHDYILLSNFLRLPQPGVPGPCIYIPQEQGGPDIPPPRHCVPFPPPLTARRATVEVFYRASTREEKNPQLWPAYGI